MIVPGPFRSPVVAALAVLLLASCGDSAPAPQIVVENGWVRAAAPGRSASAAYFTIANAGGGDRLLSVSTPAAHAAIHSMTMDGGIMRMRPLDTLEVPANGTVKLEPGSTHVMLTGIKQPLAPGSKVPVTLRFERSGERSLNLQVRAGEATDGAEN